MRQNRRFGSTNVLAAVAASLFLLPALGWGGANAQRVGDDRDVFKPRKRASQPGLPVAGRAVVTAPKQAQEPANRATGQRGKQITRLLPGANAPGIVSSDPATSPSAPTVAPNSGCVLNPGPQPASGHTCNIYETDGAGNPSEISNVITLPNVVVGGYLVLKEDPAIADSVVSNWSDVLQFGDGSNNNTTTMQLFSVGCNTPNPNDRTCFPPYSPGTSGFITESHPGPTVFFNTPNTYNIFSVDDDAAVRSWTTAGSTGAVDEDSTSIVRHNLFGVNLATGATGSVHIRYNITAVEGVSALCPASLSVIRTRFRNSDNSGGNARLTYEIRTSSINAGGNTVIYTFDSNGKGGGTGFKTATDNQAIDFNFATNMYWIEATIFRSDPNAFSDLGTIQIWEAAGTACP